MRFTSSVTSLHFPVFINSLINVAVYRYDTDFTSATLLIPFSIPIRFVMITHDLVNHYKPMYTFVLCYIVDEIHSTLSHTSYVMRIADINRNGHTTLTQTWLPRKVRQIQFSGIPRTLENYAQYQESHRFYHTMLGNFNSMTISAHMNNA
jgi:hypothetical protein